MSEEEKIPVPGDEPTGVIHWDGPANRKWPRALGVPAAGETGPGEPQGAQAVPAGVPPEGPAEPPKPDVPAADGPLEGAGEGKAADPVPSQDVNSETREISGQIVTDPPAPEAPPAAPVPAKKPPAKKTAAQRRAARKKKAAKKKELRKRQTEQPEPDPWEEERNYRPIRTRRDGRIGCLGGLMYAVFIISLSIVLAVFMWMAASDVLALNKPTNAVEITLPEEIFSDKRVELKDENGNVTGTKTVSAADIKTVSAILKDAGLINYKWLFQLYSSFSHADMKVNPGTYALSTNLDYRALVTKMQTGTGAQLQTLVMFPEGFTMDQIFARLEENGVCSKEALYEAAATAEFSYAFLEGVEPGDPYRLEGYLYPDTYYFYQGMQAASAINKFLSNMHYHVTEEMWQKANSLGMSFRQIMTIASIIEKEAANDDERALIASVLYNRLDQGMPLQLDSTVVYARRETGETRVSPEIIQATDSPYNTYLHNGLPPGPICSPGMKSIEAALNPAQSRYLYFALDMETKSIRFFIYYNEFEAFVATQDYG